MSEQSAKQSLSRCRQFKLLAVLFGLVSALLILEIALRIGGHKPWSPPPAHIRIEPGNRMFQALAEGGYRHLPGRYKVILAPEYSFQMSHLEWGLRSTKAPVSSSDDYGKPPEIWFMGCSITHGWGVNDRDTYAWKIQEKFGAHNVVNAGVGGYGTLQSRLFFQDLLQHRGKPALVVYAYGRFHDFRNTFVRTWRKGFVPNNKSPNLRIPTARLDGESLDYHLTPAEYHEWPFQGWLATSHYLERLHNFREANASRSDEVSRELIKNWAAACLRDGIQFVVAGISSDAAPMLEWCSRLGIKTIDISMPLSDPANTNHPYDNHPNAKSHTVYAERLTEFIQPILTKERVGSAD